jgi:hypothetical protein
MFATLLVCWLAIGITILLGYKIGFRANRYEWSASISSPRADAGLVGFALVAVATRLAIDLPFFHFQVVCVIPALLLAILAGVFAANIGACAGGKARLNGEQKQFAG